MSDMIPYIRKRNDQRGERFDMRHIGRKVLLIIQAGVQQINDHLCAKARPTADDYENRQLSNKLLQILKNSLDQ